MTTCIEQKHLLSGDVHEYSCELVKLDGDFGALRYVIDQAYDIDGYHLAPGDTTHAFYWTNRPYTLYLWRLPRIGQILYYFNVADGIVLRTDLFSWRDLAIDILTDGKGSVHILDEDELPPDLAPDLHAYIFEAKTRILRDHRIITAEADRLVESLSQPF